MIEYNCEDEEDTADEPLLLAFPVFPLRCLSVGKSIGGGASNS